MIAELSTKTKQQAQSSDQRHSLVKIKTTTVRIARLRLLMVAGKVVTASNRDKVHYLIHDSRTPALISFLKFIGEN